MSDIYFWIVGFLVVLGILFYFVYVYGSNRGKAKGKLLSEEEQDKEWLFGKKEAAASFESIWNDQKREFRTTINSLERQINRRMRDVVEQSRTAGEPILSDLRALLNKAQSPDQLPSGGKGANSNDDDNSLKPPITRVK